ncbi:MAG TPA: biotin-dependent carboxyltransferase family protein [Burkholderiales bacterium]|nr:biotin-dependent carboxyltransferase family protein [Burkholderiales bacterium]
MTLRVAKPGLLSTVQDRGRHGLQHLGIVPCGAMDPVAHALANALVGNDPDAATLELTVIGPELVFGHDALIALCGAEFGATLDARALPRDRPVLARARSRLVCGRAGRGSRAYLAIAGGIALEPVLGSRSTYLPARFGGLEGRALRAGDTLPLAPGAAELAAARYAHLGAGATRRDGLETVRWSAPPLTLPDREPITLHAMEGQHFALFSAAAQRVFFDATWRVGPESNRMGFRLGGPALVAERAGELLSGPTCLGTVQVPANGAPIALMADHQTTGGYPKMAEIASADVPRLAQLAPGGTLRFARCTLEDALELARASRARLEAALRAISWGYAK